MRNEKKMCIPHLVDLVNYDTPLIVDDHTGSHGTVNSFADVAVETMMVAFCDLDAMLAFEVFVEVFAI